MSEVNIYILIGRKIKNIKESKGLTQQEISDKSNFVKSTVSRIESGRTNLTLKNLFKLSEALGVKIRDLVDV